MIRLPLVLVPMIAMIAFTAMRADAGNAAKAPPDTNAAKVSSAIAVAVIDRVRAQAELGALVDRAATAASA